MFAKLDEFGILDVIVVDDYWNRKVLHGLEIEQRPSAGCVCGCQLSGLAQCSSPVCSQAHAAWPGPGPPLLNILCAPRSRAHQLGRTKRLRANFLKNSIIRSIEQPGPACTTARTTIWWRFFHSRITSKFARMTSRARQHEPCIDTDCVCRSEHSNQCFD